MIDAAVVEKEAMQLSDVQRAVLAERLIESIRPTSRQIQEAWIKEADDRMNAYREGLISSVDGPRAIAELRERFAQ